MFREELVVLAAPGVASLDALLDTGETRIVVLRAGCSYRQMLEALLARRGIAVPRLLEFGTLEAIFGCVSAGLGITLLPRALIGRVWATGRVSIHELPRADAMVETVFVRRRDGFASSALREFLACADQRTPGGASPCDRQQKGKRLGTLVLEPTESKPITGGQRNAAVDTGVSAPWRWPGLCRGTDPQAGDAVFRRCRLLRIRGRRLMVRPSSASMCRWIRWTMC